LHRGYFIRIIVINCSLSNSGLQNQINDISIYLTIRYELNVTAVDDGSCCVEGDKTPHTSTAVVVVFITDVNDNKPVFKDCSTYYPKVEEGAPNGSPVIKVRDGTSTHIT
jgi:hypothetical protein